jgi:hypothetical protein
MRLFLGSVLGLVLTVAAAGGGDAQTAASCHGTLRPREVAELMFGRDTGSHLGGGDRDWARFVAREITPRFPDGLTVTDALGQWRDRDSGRIVRESSKRVEIVLPGKDDDQTRLDAIVAAYKRQFQQQSVAIIVRTACVSF